MTSLRRGRTALGLAVLCLGLGSGCAGLTPNQERVIEDSVEAGAQAGIVLGIPACVVAAPITLPIALWATAGEDGDAAPMMTGILEMPAAPLTVPAAGIGWIVGAARVHLLGTASPVEAEGVARPSATVDRRRVPAAGTTEKTWPMQRPPSRAPALSPRPVAAAPRARAQPEPSRSTSSR